jgi:integrase
MPLRVKIGSVSIPIYPTRNGRYQSWEVRYSLAGAVVRRKFSDAAKAKAHAEDIARGLANGHADAMRMTPEDAAELFRARAALSNVGTNCVQAAQICATLRAELPGVSVEDLVACYRRHRTAESTRTIPEIVQEMLIRKRTEKGLSKVYVTGLRYRLGAFARAFPIAIADLRGPDVDDWIRAQEVSPTSDANYLRVIRTLARFAISRDYLPRDWHELDLLKPPKVENKPIEIFTPGEMRKLLECAASEHPRLVAPLALGAFAGVRSAEILRMRWEDIGPERVLVAAQKVRSAGRRFVPTQPALASWLEPVRRTGPICRCCAITLADGFSDLGAECGVPWKQNALRHSYISYRLAVVEDTARVALECGNSPVKIMRHYRELVTRDQAEAWFGIVPNPSPKIETTKNKTPQVTAE